MFGVKRGKNSLGNQKTSAWKDADKIITVTQGWVNPCFQPWRGRFSHNTSHIYIPIQEKSTKVLHSNKTQWLHQTTIMPNLNVVGHISVRLHHLMKQRKTKKMKTSKISRMRERLFGQIKNLWTQWKRNVQTADYWINCSSSYALKVRIFFKKVWGAGSIIFWRNKRLYKYSAPPWFYTMAYRLSIKW